MNHLHHAALYCLHCEANAQHEFAYAGRLLARTRCTSCGTTLQADGPFREAYLKDLRHRLQTKPARMLRRATQHPLKFTWGLPASVVTKPLKLFEELQVMQSQQDGGTDEPFDRTP